MPQFTGLKVAPTRLSGRFGEGFRLRYSCPKGADLLETGRPFSFCRYGLETSGRRQLSGIAIDDCRESSSGRIHGSVAIPEGECASADCASVARTQRDGFRTSPASRRPAPAALKPTETDMRHTMKDKHCEGIKIGGASGEVPWIHGLKDGIKRI